MRGLLTTSALVAPFLFSAALAQTAPATTGTTDTQTQTQVQTDTQTGTAPLTTTDEPTDTADDQLETDTDTAADPVTQPADTTAAPAEPVDDTAEPAETTAAPAEPVDEPADAAAAPAEPAVDAPVSDAIVREQAQNELRVDWITGTTIYSPQEERIGQISDLIFDQETHAITAAIVNVGGFLGIGAKQMAVRFDELEIDYDAREIRLNLSREDADAAPEYVFRQRAEAPAPAAPADTGTMGQPAVPPQD